MNDTESTHAALPPAVGARAERVVRPAVPKRAEVDALMKRCQIGVGGRDTLENAHSIMSDCYGTLGALMLEVERLRVGLTRLLDSDPDGAIATATEQDLREAWHDTSAECVVREQAGAVLHARALLGRLKGPNV